MDSIEFNNSLAAQFERCESILNLKAGEYATEDRLHNFRVAAALQGITLHQALAGMMAKHTVSIFDMCASRSYIPLDKWQEKLTDNINYLLLLSAMIYDEFSTPKGAGSYAQEDYHL